MVGTIFDIQRFSVHDGPGIRTTVFLKGCPLHCAWCHNPEGLTARMQLQFFETECLLCRKCVELCDCHTMVESKHIVDFEKCNLCGDCITACPSKALKVCGFEISTDELIYELLKDKDFYGNDGGVTFSGGECLMQPEFLTESLRKCKEAGLNTTIDTCGFSAFKNIQKTLKYCDLYLFDIKAINNEMHKKFTGVSNKIIIENLIKLNENDKYIWLRLPIIPEVNDNPSEIELIASFVQSLNNIQQVTLMPYHVLGKSKYETLGTLCQYNNRYSVTRKQLNSFKNIFINKIPNRNIEIII